ncbi:MAG: Stk1 family PASTA domain-containing Ser/Thr kinase, partial [Clostridium perfringens]|nr:Stk1 family PASTA domain-containing Ser/Thr kinase [Clostridium perfringens]
MIGKILGNRYELLQCVGEGGMSFVYKAKCRKLNRFVAVKILKDEFKNNEEIVRRFKKEATAIANLSNPNVVNVLDVGTQDDINYIVMEYVEGKTLKDIIKEKGALPYEVAISIGIKVAKALECAHKSGIIHRDVKPQNILVTEEGVVKVTDFGIAKSMDSSTIAHTNSVMGSAHYFSPEQAKGTYTDYRTDLYSLGIVLYEMVTGVVPFNGDSPVTVAVKHIQEKAIPPKNINQNIPNSLNDLIMKAMEKDPVNRYQTAKEIIGDLEKIKKDPNVTISSKSAEDEDQFTRVMSPVVVPNTETNNSEPDEDDEDDDEYYEDDEDDEDEDEEENNIQTKPQKAINKKKKKSPILIIIATILVVALGITLGFLGMKKFMEGGKDVKIPNVVGEKVEDAKSKLEGLGLKVLEVTEESDQEKGIVLKVDPNVDSTVK